MVHEAVEFLVRSKGTVRQLRRLSWWCGRRGRRVEQPVPALSRLCCDRQCPAVTRFAAVPSDSRCGSDSGTKNSAKPHPSRPRGSEHPNDGFVQALRSCKVDGNLAIKSLLGVRLARLAGHYSPPSPLSPSPSQHCRPCVGSSSQRSVTCITFQRR